MKTTSPRTILFLSLLAAVAVLPRSGAANELSAFDRPTKLLGLETGYCLGFGGGAQIGLGQTGFGIAGRLQLTTDTRLDLLTFLNGQLKLALGGDRRGLPAVSAGFAWYTLVTSDLVVDRVIEEAFTDEEIDVTAGLDVYVGFISISVDLGPLARAHLGYQHRFLDGRASSRQAFGIGAESDSMQVDMEIGETATQQSVLAGVDADLLPKLKIMLETGWDVTRERFRGGAGARIGLPGGVALQAGVLWPGADLGDDIELPVLPTAELHVRF